MGEILVHEFTTLDGVIDAPVWTSDYGFDPRMGEAIAGATGGCSGILLGRTTYEMFEPAWSVRTVEDDPGAPFMNDTTKYVVSSTLKDATWRNSTIVGPYDPAVIERIKESIDGDFYVSGSGTLVRALLADGLGRPTASLCLSIVARHGSTLVRRGRGVFHVDPRRLRAVRQRCRVPELQDEGLTDVSVAVGNLRPRGMRWLDLATRLAGTSPATVVGVPGAPWSVVGYPGVVLGLDRRGST